MGLRGKWIVAIVLMCAMVLVLVGCGESDGPDLSLSRVKETGELVVGIDPSYPPFENTDDKGQLSGFDVDLSNEVASRLGVKASFVAIDMGGIVDALIAKKIDVIICGMSPYPEYKKQLSYTSPYFEAGQVLAVPTGSTGVSRLDDLKGKTVTVESGSSGELEMVKQQKSLEGLVLKPMMTAPEALKAVKEGRADAGVVDSISALQYIGSEGGLKIVGSSITEEPFVVATRHKDEALFSEIDRIIVELNERGYFEQLKEKWF